MTPRRKFRTDRPRFLRSKNTRREEWDSAEDLTEDDLVIEPPRPRSKGIYLLPNLFTTAALFCGFFAIVNAMNHKSQNPHDN